MQDQRPEPVPTSLAVGVVGLTTGAFALMLGLVLGGPLTQLSFVF